MMKRYRFDAEKAVEVILYIAHTSPNMYNALKVLYFADKDHLSKHGRQLCGDQYVAMSHGPVPSGAYDLVKYARGDGCMFVDLPLEEAFHLERYNITPHREPNLELLSESDIECLDAAIEHYGHLPFGELKKLSHDDAFKSADENDFISLEVIIDTLDDGELLLEYLQDN